MTPTPSPAPIRRKVLHVLTHPPEAFVLRLIEQQRSDLTLDVRVIDMGNPGCIDAEVVQAVLEADSVATW